MNKCSNNGKQEPSRKRRGLGMSKQFREKPTIVYSGRRERKREARARKMPIVDWRPIGGRSYHILEYFIRI